MSRQRNHQSFMTSLAIRRDDVVSIVGAGGKTSLMFLLAGEARQKGWKVLVTTSTRLKMPERDQYDFIDTSGDLFEGDEVITPGIYVGVQESAEAGKVAAVDMDCLFKRRACFDLVLVEADGAAKKSLKGWNSTEPVIPGYTTKTIGVVDIRTVGRTINANLIHRLELFLKLVAGQPGDNISVLHLRRLITHPEGLFGKARGQKLLYINKVERDIDRDNVNKLRAKLSNSEIVAGSVHEESLYV